MWRWSLVGDTGGCPTQQTRRRHHMPGAQRRVRRKQRKGGRHVQSHGGLSTVRAVCVASTDTRGQVYAASNCTQGRQREGRALRGHIHWVGEGWRGRLTASATVRVLGNRGCHYGLRGSIAVGRGGPREQQRRGDLPEICTRRCIATPAVGETWGLLAAHVHERQQQRGAPRWGLGGAQRRDGEGGALSTAVDVLIGGRVRGG
jgi:hypothetical protein